MQHDDRCIGGAGDTCRDGAILRRIGIGIDRDGPGARVEPSFAAGDAELWRVHPKVAEGDDAFGAIADVAADDRIAAQEIAHAAVEQLLGLRDDAASDAEPAARTGHQLGVGGQVDDADALDAVIVDPPLQRAGVAARLHVRDDHRGRIDVIGPDAQIIRQDIGHRNGKIAIDPHIVRQPTDGRIQTGHAARARIDGHQDAIGIHPRQPLGIDGLDRRRAEAQCRRADLIIHRRRRKGAIQHQPRHHVTTAQVGCDRARRQQSCIDREVAEAAVGQIEQTACIHRQRVGLQRHPRVRLAVVQRRIDRKVQPRRRQPLDRTGQVQARGGKATQLDMAILGRDADVGELPLPQRRERATLPRLPASAPVDARGQRRLQRRHRGHHATDGCRQLGIHVEHVAIGNRIQRQSQPVATRDARPAQRRGVRHQLRAAIGDMHRAIDTQHVRLARHRLRQHQPADVQPVHVDIEVGQQRRVGVARRRLQLRPARERDEIGRQPPHVDMVARKGERPPVDVEPRAGEEYALGVSDTYVAQHHLAVERPVDAPDLDVEARRRRIAADTVGNEAAAGIGIDPQHHDADQHDEREDRDQQPFQDALPQRALRSHDHGGFGDGGFGGRHGRVVAHQYACPIEM